MTTTKKRIAHLAAVAAAVMCAGATAVTNTGFQFMPQLSVTASAATSVTYINDAGSVKKTSDYTLMTSSTKKLTGGYYVVDGNVTIDSRIKVTDDSYIIITDGSKLVAKAGINVASGVEFTVYTQDGGTGSLYAGTTNGSNSTASDGYCGIGGDGAFINLCGGNIYVKGGSGAIGVLGKSINLGWSNSWDTIYANSYSGAVYADKALANRSNGTIFDGKISSTDIKGATLSAVNTIDKNTTYLTDGAYAVMNGVTVANRITVDGDVDLFLGSNGSLRADEGITVNRGSSLVVSGTGKLYAGTTNGTSFSADDNNAGIGSENGARAGEIIIKSGTVYANGGRNAAGIGGSNAVINITGGKVTANGGRNAAGIGSGYSDNGSDIRITGGNINATGGSNAAGIGSGNSSSNSSITLGYTNNSDSIYASSYRGSVSFTKTLYQKGTNVAATSSNIDGKTLIPTASVSSYTVTFNSNGGSSVSSMRVNAGSTITTPTPTRRGYVFGGWYTDRNFNNYFYDGRTVINSDITLYAYWIGDFYTISYNSMGGSTVNSRTVTIGQPAGASEAPTRAGYEFAGWYTDRNCTQLFNISEPLYSDITLYAGWTSNANCTIYFDSMGGSYVSPITVSNGTRVSYPDVPIRSGYDFYGWFTDSNYRYEYEFNTAVTSDLYLYAKWVKQETQYCTISFDSMGGTRVSSTTVEYGKRINYPSAPTRSGYEFIGWYTDPGCSILFDFSDSVYSDMTLYAGWFENAPTYYTVRFQTNGAGSVADQYVMAGDQIDMLPYLERPGYIFDDWYTNSSLTSRFNQYSSITSDMTLYAGWIEDVPAVTYVTVYFESMGGSYIAPVTIESGSTVSNPGSPYLDGYMFGGWCSDSNALFAFDFSTPIYSDTTLYANWVYDESASYYGSTFNGGLVAAIAGGVALVGGGVAAGVIINKKKKNAAGKDDDSNKDEK